MTMTPKDAEFRTKLKLVQQAQLGEGPAQTRAAPLSALESRLLRPFRTPAQTPGTPHPSLLDLSLSLHRAPLKPRR